MKLNPAEYLAYVMGGYASAARMIGRDPSAVSRWKSNNGTVPSSAFKTILELAKKKRLDITSDDLLYGRDVKTRRISVPI